MLDYLYKIIRTLFLDVIACIKGFIYGFVVIGLTMFGLGAITYLLIMVKNVIW